MEQEIAPGHFVRLISLELSEQEEDGTNWILKEKSNPQIGDTFEVLGMGKHWLHLKGLEFRHPSDKFQKI